MRYFIPVAFLLALTACGNEEQVVVLPEQAPNAVESAPDTAKESSASKLAKTSESFGSSGTAGSSGSSGASDVSGSPDTYIVKKGDTLTGIAKQHNVSYQDLARWNKIKDSNHIYPSQKLRLSAP